MKKITTKRLYLIPAILWFIGAGMWVFNWTYVGSEPNKLVFAAVYAAIGFMNLSLAGINILRWIITRFTRERLYIEPLYGYQACGYSKKEAYKSILWNCKYYGKYPLPDIKQLKVKRKYPYCIPYQNRTATKHDMYHFEITPIHKVGRLSHIREVYIDVWGIEEICIIKGFFYIRWLKKIRTRSRTDDYKIRQRMENFLYGIQTYVPYGEENSKKP